MKYDEKGTFYMHIRGVAILPPKWNKWRQGWYFHTNTNLEDYIMFGSRITTLNYACDNLDKVAILWNYPPSLWNKVDI